MGDLLRGRQRRQLADTKPSTLGTIFGFVLVGVAALIASVQIYYLIKGRIKKRRKRDLQTRQQAVPKRQTTSFFKNSSNHGRNYDGDLASSSPSSNVAASDSSSSSVDMMAQELRIAANRDTRVWKDYEEQRMKLVEEGRVVGRVDQYDDDQDDVVMVLSDDSNSMEILPITAHNDWNVDSPKSMKAVISDHQPAGESKGVVKEYSPYGDEDEMEVEAQYEDSRLVPNEDHRFQTDFSDDGQIRTGMHMSMQLSPERPATIARDTQQGNHRGIPPRPYGERRSTAASSAAEKTVDKVPTKDSSNTESNSDTEALMVEDIDREFRRVDEASSSDLSTKDSLSDDSSELSSDDSSSAIVLLKSLTPSQDDDNDHRSPKITHPFLQAIMGTVRNSPLTQSESRNAPLKQSETLNQPEDNGQRRGPLTESDTKVLLSGRPREVEEPTKRPPGLSSSPGMLPLDNSGMVGPSDETSTSSDSFETPPTEEIVKEVELLKTFVQRYEKRRERELQEERELKRSSPGIESSSIASRPSGASARDNDRREARSDRLSFLSRARALIAGTQEAGDDLKIHRSSSSTDSTTGDSSDPTNIQRNMDSPQGGRKSPSSYETFERSPEVTEPSRRVQYLQEDDPIQLTRSSSEEDEPFDAAMEQRRNSTKNVRFNEMANQTKHFNVDSDDDRYMLPDVGDNSAAAAVEVAEHGLYEMEEEEEVVPCNGSSSDDESWEGVEMEATSGSIRLGIDPRTLQSPPHRAQVQQQQTLNEAVQTANERMSRIPSPGQTGVTSNSPAKLTKTKPPNDRSSKIPPRGHLTLQNAPRPDRDLGFTDASLPSDSAVASPEKETSAGDIPIQEIKFSSPPRPKVKQASGHKQGGGTATSQDAGAMSRESPGVKSSSPGIKSPSPNRIAKSNPKFSNIVNMFEAKPKNSIYPPNESWQYSY